MKELRKILWPFSLLYNGITALRNVGFNKGIFKETKHKVTLINVGNLSTGGTGKSPMVTYISTLFNQENTAVLSRGYGRKTKGLYIVKVSSQASEVGDEPLQLKQRFPMLTVVVSENRNLGVEHILENFKNTKQIILDDAYQHRSIKSNVNILLTTYAQPFYSDLVLPAGNLRENRFGAQRADIVVVTKCKSALSEEEAKVIRAKIATYSKKQVYFAGLQYGVPTNYLDEYISAQSNVHLVTGIANPEPLVKHINAHYTLLSHLQYLDHYNFKQTDIEKITNLLKDGNISILTTGKDYVRLRETLPKRYLERVFIQDISIEFLFNKQADFQETLINKIKELNM